MQRDRRGRTARSNADRARRPPQGFRTAHVERFAQVAADALADLPEPVAGAAAGADLTIAGVPPPVAEPGAEPRLAAFVTARPGQRAHLTLFRGPIELRAYDRSDLVDVIRAATIAAVADALGNPPELDPGDR